MGLYIKNIKMSEHCMDCPFMVSRDNDDCILQSAEANENFENWEQMKAGCPLVSVPDQHGRLIDADALHKLFEDQWDYLQVLDKNENPTAEANQSGINWCINTMHDDAPTVIPASESKERPAFLPQYELTPRSEGG